MSSDPITPSPRVEVITSVQRRRRWSTAEKVRLVEEAMQPGFSVSFVARRYGISPSLLFTWKRRMLEGGHQAVAADEDVVGTSKVRELERRVRDLERLLGRKTMEVEILKEALDLARRKKTDLAARAPGAIGRAVRDEGRRRHAWASPAPIWPSASSQAGPAARPLPQAGGRHSPAAHPQDRGCSAPPTATAASPRS